MKTKSPITISLLMLGWLVKTSVAPAAVITWTNTNAGFWSAATNWSPNTLPTAGDDVAITAVGDYTVTQDVPVTVASLTLGGASGQQTLTNNGFNLTLNGPSIVNAQGTLGFSAGTVNGPGVLTVNGRFNWAGGNLRASAVVAGAGVLELSGAADKGLTGGLTNHGTITWSGTGNLYFDPTLIDNRPGALFDIQNDAALILYNGTPFVTNAGTIRKSAGTGTNIFNGVPLRNTGAVEVQTGTIFYSANGCLFDTGTQFKGAGTNALGAGLITLNGLISSENLVLAGAVISGTNTLSGTIQWTAGAIDAQGVVTIGSGGALNLDGPAIKAIVGVLYNDGLITWSGAENIHMGSSMIHNRSGGIFEAVNDASIIWTVNGQPVFTNAGTFRKTAGTGTTFFSGVVFCNTGIVDAQIGTVSFGVTGSTFENGSQLLGAGTNLLSGGLITLNGLISSENLVLAGASIIGTNTLSGTVQWTAGAIEAQGAVTIGSSGILNLSGPAVKAIIGVLNNDGRITWSGAGNIHMGSSMIHNRSGGIFEAANDASIVWAVNGQPVFTNAGTFRKTAGNGTTLFSGVVFRNSGIVDAQIGTVSFGVTGSTFENGSQLLGAGTNLLSGGSITLNGSIFSQNLEFGGAVISGTNLLGGTINWTAGYIDGPGVMTIATNGILNLTGPFEKGVVGVLKNRGTVRLSGTGRLAMGSSSVLATMDNEPTGLFDVSSDAAIVWAVNGQPVFTNAGTFRKTAGNGTTLFSGVVFRNSGIVDAQIGTVSFGVTGSTFENGSQLLGAGTNLLSSGSITLNGSIFSQNLEFGGAVISGTNLLGGTINWTAGYIDGPGVMTIATNGILNLTGPFEKGVVGVLKNRGTVRLSGTGRLAIGSSSALATIDNEPTGLFDVSSDAAIVWTVWSQPLFTNAGTFRKSGGTGFADLSGVPFQNTGTVDAQSGVIRFLSTYTQSGGRLQFGLASLANFGQVQFAQSAPLTGTLGANVLGEFKPKAGDAFAVISSYPVYTGAFTAFDLSPIAAWQTNDSIYGANVVTLTVLNARPALDPIGDKTGDEESAITFTATAADPDLAQTVSFSLLDAPSGATISTNTGAFSWTPTEAQGPSTNTFAVQVSDNGTPALTHTQNVTVVVNEVNRAPTTTPLTLAPVNELAPLVLATNLATDPDLPTNALSFALINPPDGALIDAATGVITWTPSEAQGPSTNAISVRITDSGWPSLDITNTFTLVVAEVNTAPTLAPLSNLTDVAGAICWITNSALDPDLPTNRLTFSLVNPPPGMIIGPTSGLIIWAPPLTCAPLTNTVTVRVTDNEPSALTDEKSFVAKLIAQPRLRIASAGTNLVVVSWPADVTDAGLVLQSATNLLSPVGWTNVAGTPNVIAGENFLTNNTAAGFRAYRLASGLTPLPTLQIATTDPSAVMVSWPSAATAIGFVPQTAPNLYSSVAWSDATNSISTNGNLSFISDSLAGTQRYYRLRLPALP